MHNPTSPAVVLLRNPRSGRERAVAVTTRLIESMRLHGVEMLVVDLVADGSHVAKLKEAALGAKALVIAGGDGTVHYSLDLASAMGLPVYHLPLGNENLFAREYAMDLEAATLLAALEEAGARTMDLGDCNGRAFALMVSVGFDASVVERVVQGRTGGVRHRDYVRHALAEARSPRWPRIGVEVDGERCVDGAKGWLVIANSRQYGARLDPARNARPDDGLLDMVFMPASSRLGLVRWGLRLLAGTHLDHPSIVVRRGRRVVMEAIDSPVAVQIDGEFAGNERRLECTVRPGVLRVLSV